MKKIYWYNIYSFHNRPMFGKIFETIEEAESEESLSDWHYQETRSIEILQKDELMNTVTKKIIEAKGKGNYEVKILGQYYFCCKGVVTKMDHIGILGKTKTIEGLAKIICADIIKGRDE